MADNEVAGTVWRDDEQDLIVADYFAMLEKELAGEPYVKAHHRAALMEQLQRSNKSVEFKHQNISAVLEVLGLPRIQGYRPAMNFQNSLFDAIDRYLSGNREQAFRAPPQAPFIMPALSSVFVDVPGPLPQARKNERLERLVRKFDPVERDFRNRALGKSGEEFVMEIERKTLTDAGRSDLARKIRWVSAEDGDGAGYDISSFAPTGKERLIEVKTTNGAARTPFYMTRVECEVAKERAGAWHLYRVHQFAQEPKIFTVQPPLDKALRLDPETWRVSPLG